MIVLHAIIQELEPKKDGNIRIQAQVIQEEETTGTKAEVAFTDGLLTAISKFSEEYFKGVKAVEHIMFRQDIK